MFLAHLSQMIEGIDESQTGLVVRVQEAIMVLVKRRPVEASSISREYEIILHLVEGEVLAMLPPLIHQVSIE